MRRGTYIFIIQKKTNTYQKQNTSQTWLFVTQHLIDPTMKTTRAKSTDIMGCEKGKS